VRDFLTELVVSAEQVAPGCVCALTLVRDGRPFLLAVSDYRAADLEQVQYLHDGPTMLAAGSHCPVLIDDLLEHGQWPEYRQCAAGSGVRSALYVPAVVDDQQTVILALHAPRARAFGPDEQRTATQYAEEADRSVALAVRLSQTERTAWNLELALESRSVIAQAVGVIMAENRCDERSAFAILKTASQNRNTKLRDVARQIVLELNRAPAADGAGPETSAPATGHLG
jgi:GAF domain-containing protein